MSPNIPTPGRIVMFHSPAAFNGITEHPAVVTRQWGKTPGSCINVKVLPDCASPFDATSLFIYDSFEDGINSGNLQFCYWPPRA